MNISNQKLTKSNIQDLYRLSPMQEGIYFHYVAATDSKAYFSQVSYRLTGLIQPDFAEQAMMGLFKRHDILRTVFTHGKTDHIIQVVLKSRQPDFKYEDLRGVADKEDHLQRRRIADRSTPFDLGRDVLMRVQLFRLADNEYEFLWSHHHILMDGWCTGILLQEFAQLYAGLANGRPVQLPRSVPYRAFIQWLEGCDRQQAADHWQKVLAHTTRPTGLPRNKTAQPGSPYQNREVALQLDATLTARIQARAAATQVTLNTFLQGVWSVLLSKYNSCDQVVFGTVAAVRPAAIPGVESMVGLLINTLPVSVCIDHRQPFHQLLQQMQGDALAAAPFHYFPLADIQAQSTLKQQLIDHVFITENFPTEPLDKQKEKNTPQVAFKENFSQTNYDLNLIILPGELLRVRFNYNGQVYDERYIHALSRQFAALLTQVVDATPDLLTGDLRLLSDLQQQTLLQLGRGPQSQYPANTLDALFRRQVRLRGEHPALATAQGPLSYLTLHQQASQLCTRLRQHGITPGTAVGVCCGRSTHGMILSMIALAYCSAIYVPLDPDHPIQRLQYILDDSSIQLILTSEPFLPLCQSLSKKLLRVDDNHYPDGPHSEPEPAQPHHIAYHIYTSGSTGNPKGVPIRHDSIADRVCYHIEYLRLRTDDAVLQFAAVAFDASIMEVWMALLAGARLVLLDDHAKQQLPVFTQHILDNAVSTLILPPAYLRLLNRHPLPSVTRIISTGEAANVDDMRWYAAQGKLVYNGYGPTEVCVGATFYQMPPEHLPESGQHNPIPIGTPFSNTLVCLLDHHQQLLPEGAPGEICIGGIGLSPGYLNAPELAASRFLTPRFDTSAGRLYRTGDRGRWNSNGQLEFLGRIDSQVQIRGIRVEPAEIEQTLLAFPGITQAAVIYFADPPETLVAFLATDNPPDTENLRRHLAGKLPQYMIPAQFVLLEQLPLTSNGKIDRIILQRPVATMPEDKQYLAPATPLEALLADIFAKVLGLQRVSMNDDFFRMGGDSIKAIQISSRLHREGFQLDIKNIFANPGISQLAGFIQPVKRQIDQAFVTGRAGLTPIQQEFLYSDFRRKHHYNQAVLLTPGQRLHAAFVRPLLETLVDHHDALRMNFRQETQEWLQFNEASHRWDIQVEEFELRGNNDEPKALAGTLKEIQESLRLDGGYLIRAAIMHLTDGDRLLLLVHHLVVDGISWRILLEDIGQLYRQTRQGLQLSLPPKTDSFLRWTEFLSAYAGSDRFIREQAYWLEKDYSGIDKRWTAMAATDAPQPGKGQARLRLAPDETNYLLHDVHNAYGTEINDILLTALSRSLCDILGQDDIWIDLEGHGRESLHSNLNINRTIGWFTSIYPIRLCATARNDPGRHLTDIKEALRDIPAHGLGYGLLCYRKEYQSTWARRAQIIFNYLGQFDADIDKNSFHIAAEDTGPTQGSDEALTHGLQIIGIVSDARLHINITYDRSHYGEAAMNTLCDALKRNLLLLIHHCRASKSRTLTPSDLGYKGLSVDELRALSKACLVSQDAPIENIYPLTPTQEGILFHHLTNSTSTSYLHQVTYELTGASIDPRRAEAAANQLLSRHEMLRCLIEYDNAHRFLAIVLKERQLKITYTDLSHLPMEKCRSRIEDFCRTDRNTRFDLRNETLLRITLFKTRADRFVFVWSSHHIVLDGWCMGILIAEFTHLYANDPLSSESQLPAPPSYGGFIDWLGTQEEQEGLRFWTDYLAGYDRKIIFPQSSKKDNGETFDEARITLQLSDSETRALGALAVDTQVTLNVLLQTLWGILLGYYNQCDDVVFGSVVSGRPPEVPGIESMIGLFINTLPVRVRFTGEQSFRAAVQEQHENSINAQPYHHNSLARIQQQTPLQHELIDHITEFLNYPLADRLEGLFIQQDGIASHAGWRVQDIKTNEHNHYDLTVIFEPSSHFSIHFQFNRNAYDDHFIRKMGARLHGIVRQVLTDPYTCIKDLQFNTSSEKEKLLMHSGGIDTPLDTQDSVIRRFCEQAARFPEATAVRDKTCSLNYDQLHRWSDSIAARLGHHSGHPEKAVVAVLMERSALWVASVLGIWKAGLTYLPIDPHLPVQRIELMMLDSAASFIIVNGNAVPAGLSTSCIDLAETRPVAEPMLSYANNAFDQAAYLIYTSGSTGLPKGVLVTHGGMLNHLDSRVRRFDVDQHCRFAQTASQSFDISIWQMMTALISGGQVRVYDRAEVLDVKNMVRWLAYDQLTHINFVPTYLATVLDVLETIETDLRFPSLRFIASLGEELKASLARRCQKMIPNATMVNCYGPSETTDTIADHVLPDGFNGDRVPLGKPIQNTSVYIVDRFGHLCPEGIPGEIWIAGIAVGAGYLGLPARTRESFVREPFSGKLLRCYKTGDLGSRDSQGLLYFHGRKDYQVKIRGYRVELGEIERVLSAHIAVGMSAIIYQDTGNGHLLVGYFKWKNGAETHLTELFAWLQRHLPEYMIPSRLIPLEAFPTTTSGKLDRKALPRPEPSDQEPEPADDQPWSLLEQLLARLWSAILKIENPGRKDDFFRSGGDSIRAMQMSIKAHSDGFVLPVQDIFAFPQLKNLAARMVPLQEQYEKRLSSEPFPLSPYQKRLLSMRTATEWPYHLIKWVFPGYLEKQLLESVLQTVIDMHDCFRIVSSTDESGNKCRFSDEALYSIKWFDPADLAVDDSNTQKLAASLLAADTPARGRYYFIIDNDEDSTRIFLFIHNLYADSHSLSLIGDHLFSALTGKVKHAHSFQNGVPSVSDWIHGLQKKYPAEQLGQENQYLKQLSAQTESLDLNSRADFSVAGLREVSFPFRIPTSRQKSVDDNDFLLAAFALAARQVFGGNNLSFMVETDYRDYPLDNRDFSKTSGCLAFRFPVQIHLADKPSAQYLVQVRQTLLTAPLLGLLCDPDVVGRTHSRVYYPASFLKPSFIFRRYSFFAAGNTSAVDAVENIDLAAPFPLHPCLTLSLCFKNGEKYVRLHCSGGMPIELFGSAFQQAFNLALKTFIDANPGNANDKEDNEEMNSLLKNQISVSDLDSITAFLNQ